MEMYFILVISGGNGTVKLKICPGCIRYAGKTP
jgi:hypothetical protein